VEIGNFVYKSKCTSSDGSKARSSRRTTVISCPKGLRYEGKLAAFVAGDANALGALSLRSSGVGEDRLLSLAYVPDEGNKSSFEMSIVSFIAGACVLKHVLERVEVGKWG